MDTRIIAAVSGVTLILSNTLVQADTATFNTGFSASQSLFQGGPSAGFDKSGSAGSSVGIAYSAKANSGTVTANVNGQIQANYTSLISNPNAATTVNLNFNGGSSAFSSALGAAANVTGFLDVCVIPNIFTGGCVTRIDTDFDLLNKGLYLNPGASSTANLGTGKSASDAASAVGFGPNLDLVIGELGAVVNLDIDQQIALSLQGIDGILGYSNRRTGESLFTSFTIGASDQVDVLTQDLSTGIWDFSLLGLSLGNTFSNDVDLELRPTINYVLGEWPAPGSSPISLGLINESFSLNFNTLQATNLFSVQVVPVPAAAWLFGSALLGLVGIARRRA